jgi:hypothetical protein
LTRYLPPAAMERRSKIRPRGAVELLGRRFERDVELADYRFLASGTPRPDRIEDMLLKHLRPEVRSLNLGTLGIPRSRLRAKSTEWRIARFESIQRDRGSSA